MLLMYPYKIPINTNAPLTSEYVDTCPVVVTIKRNGPLPEVMGNTNPRSLSPLLYTRSFWPLFYRQAAATFLFYHLSRNKID